MTFFGNLRLTASVGALLALALVIVLALLSGKPMADYFGHAFWTFVVRWVHVVASIVWIGLLFYFNLVQIPSMPRIPEEQRPAVGKVIAPAALFWFRWSAPVIGIGMWLGLILWANVWFVIWPAQKKALGLKEGSPEERARAAARSVIAARVGLLLILPTIYCMVAAQNIG